MYRDHGTSNSSVASLPFFKSTTAKASYLPNHFNMISMSIAEMPCQISQKWVSKTWGEEMKDAVTRPKKSESADLPWLIPMINFSAKRVASS